MDFWLSCFGSNRLQISQRLALIPDLTNFYLDLALLRHRKEALFDFSNGSSVIDTTLKVLDVRSPPEVEQHGTIPGALNINVRTLEDTLALSQEDFENQVIEKQLA